MAIPQIILKKSSVVSKVPLVGDLTYGELALNYADGLLYYKRSDGTTIASFKDFSNTDTISIGDNATASGNTKTINIGTGGVSGSFTNINYGSGNSASVHTMVGTLVTTNINTGYGVTTGDASIELGNNRTGSGNAILDFHSSASSDFDFRLLKAAGINGNASIVNAGTGSLSILQAGAGPLLFSTNSTERLRIDANGNAGFNINSSVKLFDVYQPTNGPGTVTNTAGSTTVTGTNTYFTSTFRTGDTITIGGQTVAISAIASDTSMTVAAITNANTSVTYTLVGGSRFRINGSGDASFGSAAPIGNVKLTVNTVSQGTDGLRISHPTGNQFIQLMPNMGAGNYNNLVAAYDTGILYQSGTQNASPGFVIVPWNIGTGGIRLDQYGNLSVGSASSAGLFNVVQGSTGPGIVTNTAGSTTVTGTYTKFTSTFAVGDTVTIGGQAVVISAIASDTSMTTAAITNANTNVGYGVTAVNRFNVLGNGYVGIGTTAPKYKLDIQTASLASTAGTQSVALRLTTPTNNTDALEFTNTRVSTGSDWTTAGFRIQQKVDASWMGYIQFNGPANNGITFGTGTSTTASTAITERLRINNVGNVSIGSAGDYSDSALVISKTNSGTTGYGIRSLTSISSNITSSFRAYQSVLNTTNAAFTMGNFMGYLADNGYVGNGTIVSNYYGVFLGATATLATNNIGIAGGFNTRSSGSATTATISNIQQTATTVTVTTTSAHGYTTGQVVTVTATANATDLVVGAPVTILTLGTTDWNVVAGTTGITYAAGSTFTVAVVGTGTGTVTLNSQGSGKAITVTTTTAFTYTATSATFAALIVTGTVTVAVNWNLYLSGTAPNYIAGNVGIGATPSGNYNLEISGTASISSNVVIGGSLTARYTTKTTATATATAVTPDVSTYNQYSYTALASALTINAPIGTPVDGDKLTIRIIDNGTSQTLTWNSTYTVIGTVLPTTTTASKMIYVGCIYNASLTRWDVTAVARQA